MLVVECQCLMKQLKTIEAVLKVIWGQSKLILCLRPPSKYLVAKSKIKTEGIKLKIGDCFLKWQIKPTMWAGDVKHRIKFGQPINHWSSVLSYIKPLNPCFKFYSLLH